MSETVAMSAVDSKLLPNGQEMVTFTTNTNGATDDASKGAIAATNNEEDGVSKVIKTDIFRISPPLKYISCGMKCG